MVPAFGRALGVEKTCSRLAEKPSSKVRYLGGHSLHKSTQEVEAKALECPPISPLVAVHMNGWLVVAVLWPKPARRWRSFRSRR